MFALHVPEAHIISEAASLPKATSFAHRANIIKKSSFVTKRGFFVARLGGLEPTTYWFVARHSIQLS